MKVLVTVAVMRSRYYDALKIMGAEEVEDLKGLEESDCAEMGMKQLEIKRFFRALKAR